RRFWKRERRADRIAHGVSAAARKGDVCRELPDVEQVAGTLDPSGAGDRESVHGEEDARLRRSRAKHSRGALKRIRPWKRTSHRPAGKLSSAASSPRALGTSFSFSFLHFSGLRPGSTG